MVDWWVHAFVYDFKAKKWSHLRTFFATSWYRYPEVVNIFMNISAKTKIFWDVDLGPRYYRLFFKPELENLMLLSL